MWSHERQAKILELLGRDGKVLTNHLAELLAVSRETVRRDLLEMETSGSLSRVHGGAILPGAEILPEPAFAQRLGDHAQAKDAIATKACELIPAGATLMIDTGTTTLAFARALGCTAKLCIHPQQVSLIHQFAQPSAEQVAWAEKVLAAIAGAAGAVQVDGKMVDRPVALKAEAILARHHAAAGRRGE